MIGAVDEKGRALLEVSIAQNESGFSTPIVVWIDTAFDGHLVCSQSLINEMGLRTLAQTEAVLADGSLVVLATYLCYVDWFGSRLPIQAIANEGIYPLLGTSLLEGRVLHVDYANRNLQLD